MPKVQGYNPGQVKPTALPASRFSANATAESFGGGDAAEIGKIGKAGQELGGVINKFAIEQQDIKDKAVAREALVAATDAQLKHGASVWELKGEPATRALDTMNEGLVKIRQEYSKNLSPRQRDLFLASFDSKADDYKQKAMLFQVQATDAYEKTTLTAENQSAIDLAIANRTDPKSIRDAENTISANTLRLNRGQENVTKKQALIDAMDLLHNKVLGAIAQDSPIAAQEYFKANEKRFKPDGRDALRKSLEDKAFDFDVRMKAVDLSNSGLSLEEQLKMADKERDPKKADELRKRVKEKYEDKKLAKESADAEALKAEWQQMIQNPKDYQIPYERLNKNEWQAMESFKKAKLNGFALSSDTGEVIRYGLMTDQELKAVPVTEVAAAAKNLTEKDWKEVFGRYQALRGGKGAAEVTAGMTQIRTDAALLTDTLNAVGIKTDKGQNKEVVDKLFRAYQSELSQEELKLGRKLTPPEKQQVVDDLFVKGKIKNFSIPVGPFSIPLPGGSRRVYELQPDEWQNFTVKEVPQEEQVKIVEALNRKGLPVNKATIQKIYLQKLESRRK